jgi:dinuclear metal center YbgI/SA1388 family protein
MATRRGSKARANGGGNVAGVLEALEALAPLRGAADWDNVGLLAGRPEWPAQRVLVTIDLTDDVADEALQKDVDVVVAYHPPIFKGIQAVTPAARCPTTRLPDLLAARISIIALHTALDAAVGGTNDVLLDGFDVVERWPLEPAIDEVAEYKLVVFVPPAEVAGLRRALSAAGAGVIGNYSECSYELAGRGTFFGDETTNPTVGERGQLEYADETRLEMVVPRSAVGPVVRTLYAAHSYEEPAFDLYPLHRPAGRGAAGMGRVGRLRKVTRGPKLIAQLGQMCDLSGAQTVGPVKRSFKRVIAAAGAYGVGSFRDPEALVLTGEFKHHDALELLRRDVTAVHIGHAASERPVRDLIRQHLRGRLSGVRVELARRDVVPFVPVRVE